jgi:RNA polymerase sigma-B factor
MAATAPTRILPFRPRRDADLIFRYGNHGDRRAREVLTRRFMPLARDLARRYIHTGEPLEDLTQVAYLGLLKAIDRFELGRGVRFTSYAVPTIHGELRRYVRDRAWAVHMPRDLQEGVLAMNRRTEDLSTRLGRSPSVREVAGELGWSSEQLLEVRDAALAYKADSLDAPVEDGSAGTGIALVDTLGSEDGRYELIESRAAIASAWRTLPERERCALRLRFDEELTQQEIGERIGVSQMHVSRLLRHAMEHLREAA